MDFYSIYRNFSRGLYNSYRKNKDDIRALTLGIYPSYFYRRTEKFPKGEIPIFVFHSVEEEYFEEQISYLSENDYHTIKADELHEIIIGRKKPLDKTVVLTFDDGRGSLWSIAYPLLKKYGLHAISFVVPHNVSDKSEYYPNLEDAWDSKYGIEEIKDRELHEPFCTWGEITTMHRSGTVDFQSHTAYHHTIFISDRIVDFVNPSFDPSPLTSDINPVVRIQGEDFVLRNLEWGRPIYRSAPAMSGKRRYIEDQELSQACISFVEDNGDVFYFDRPRWRKALINLVRDFAKKHPQSGHFQTIEETYNEIRQDLWQSKTTIEQRLDKEVKHLCFPWYVGSKIAVKASKEIGYCCNYWGILSRRAVNGPGTNPYYLARINDDYILTLPGNKRIPLYNLLSKKMARISRKKLCDKTSY